MSNIYVYTKEEIVQLLKSHYNEKGLNHAYSQDDQWAVAVKETIREIANKLGIPTEDLEP